MNIRGNRFKNVTMWPSIVEFKEKNIEKPQNDNSKSFYALEELC